MILQYFVTEEASGKTIPIEIDRATMLILPLRNPAGKATGRAISSVIPT